MQSAFEVRAVSILIFTNEETEAESSRNAKAGPRARLGWAPEPKVVRAQFPLTVKGQMGQKGDLLKGLLSGPPSGPVL